MQHNIKRRSGEIHGEIQLYSLIYKPLKTMASSTIQPRVVGKSGPCYRTDSKKNLFIVRSHPRSLKQVSSVVTQNAGKIIT